MGRGKVVRGKLKRYINKIIIIIIIIIIKEKDVATFDRGTI